jgi:predicted TIM-barrel fold metal-dependent hydrolase
MFVIDVHHHVGFPGDNGKPLDGVQVLDEVQRRTAVMDGHGVDQAFVIPSHAYDRRNGTADTRRANDNIAMYRDANPDRFPAAACIVEPTHGDAGLEELSRCKEDLGIRAVSIHTRFQGVSLNDPSVSAIVARAIELEMVPVIHAYPEDIDEALWKAVQFARKMPPVPMIILDAFATYESTHYCWEAAELCPNFVFDTALAYTFERIQSFVDAFGPERVLFGSDTYSSEPGQPTTHLLRQILGSSLSDDAKSLICAGNAVRLLGTNQ